MVNFSWRSDHFFHRHEPNCGENALSHNVEESFKKFLNPHADDLQTLISSSLTTGTSLVKFSRSDQQFLREVANRLIDRHTDTQTNAR